jgi:hypothetical protein
LTIEPVVLDRDILTFDIPGLAKPFAKRRRTGRSGLGGPKVDDSDHRHRTLLRARRERPSRRAAEERDELATFDHSITSSASARIRGGNSKFIA